MSVPDTVFMSVCVYVCIIILLSCAYKLHPCNIILYICTVCGCVHNMYVHVSTLCDSSTVCTCVCVCLCIY